ncbi:hypothetical protein PI2015_1288 [Pseudoalteromonas issachenkonii]|uniref:Uncharacterized protein n=1 Tax=Pseudoalteromonas issachenkonii TaxID=152297 RepID=A0ABM6N2J6_9GAMM|nr:hypothetical protein [Pseudoalteromonas issachenkonii]ALQ54596.1 hypothetical protein PI2015_1288 [Pseudoalteromonas issachenkonii]ATC90398.1 hypothetical protein PISS_a1474 [Pseudoalteromonas issachenkonii]
MKKDEFLNPRSMSTPAACGGIVIIITNSLVFNFSISAVWTALAFSALLALLVLYAKNIEPWEKALHYIVNTFLIFSFAAGANQGIHKAATPEIAYAATNPSASIAMFPEKAIPMSIDALNQLEFSLASIYSDEKVVNKSELMSIQQTLHELTLKLKSVESNISKSNPDRIEITGSRIEKPFFTDWLN